VRRPSHKTALLLVGIAQLLPFRPTPGQDRGGARGGNGVILGTVTDSALRPVAEADVSIFLSRVHVTADARGRFQIVDVPSGNYLLMVRRLGYGSVAAGVTVQIGDTLRLAFTLERSVAQLGAVIVTEHSASARLREFEERRRHGAGEFFDQQEVERRNAVSVVDILRDVKGLRVSTEGSKLFAMSARQWTPCPMQLYVDGIPMAGASYNVPFDLNLLPSPKEIMGIEVYSGAESEPLWLPAGPSGGKRSCGAVLVWTRDGSLNRP